MSRIFRISLLLSVFVIFVLTLSVNSVEAKQKRVRTPESAFFKQATRDSILSRQKKGISGIELRQKQRGRVLADERSADGAK